MGEKIQQTMDLEVWNLTTPADMFECFSELVVEGYRGEIKAYPLKDDVLPEGVPRVPGWFLELNAADKSITAALGQTVVLFGGVLEAMTPEAYTARFG